jgi:hypothetical protein
VKVTKFNGFESEFCSKQKISLLGAISPPSVSWIQERPVCPAVGRLAITRIREGGRFGARKFAFTIRLF